MLVFLSCELLDAPGNLVLLKIIFIWSLTKVPFGEYVLFVFWKAHPRLVEVVREILWWPGVRVSCFF